MDHLELGVWIFLRKYVINKLRDTLFINQQLQTWQRDGMKYEIIFEKLTYTESRLSSSHKEINVNLTIKQWQRLQQQ
jgi:hypothetical protein